MWPAQAFTAGTRQSPQAAGSGSCARGEKGCPAPFSALAAWDSGGRREGAVLSVNLEDGGAPQHSTSLCNHQPLAHS